MSEPRIHVLDKRIAEQIAAGEVVERPASVVKELIENSIDAGARAISVEIREGGLSLIRVNDNGKGLERRDAELVAERHATSKIKSVDDLFQIRTFGFRGEALAAIAGVAQVEILTRTEEEIEGTRVLLYDGRKEIKVAGAPIGAQVTVRDLFFNTPARRKFLKAPLREGELVQKMVMTYALATPRIAYRLIVDGREALVAPAGTGLERIGAVWGRDIASEMLQIDYMSVDLAVRGFVSRPTLARGGRDWQLFLVNGRPVRSGLLAVTLERAFAGRLAPNRHPLAILDIQVAPRLVDVNVHPRKAEVRLYQERAAYGAVAQAIENALREFPQNTSMNQFQWPFAAMPETEASSVPAARETRTNYRASLAGWRAVAQIHNTYILAQSLDGLVIVDQHAAQEQIFYERLTAGAGWNAKTTKGREDRDRRETGAQDLGVEALAGFGDSTSTKPAKASTPQSESPLASADSNSDGDDVSSQMKVTGHAPIAESPSHPITHSPTHPVTLLQLMPREAELLNAHLDVYRRLGIDIEPFGENTFRVNARPSFVKLSASELMNALLQEHERIRTLEGDALFDRLAAKAACISAIKAGDILTPEMQQALLEDLMRTSSPATCPHGRPVFVSLDLEELERRFLRR